MYARRKLLQIDIRTLHIFRTLTQFLSASLFTGAGNPLWWHSQRIGWHRSSALRRHIFLNCGVDVLVHVSQDELCTAGKLRAAKGEASRVWRFLSTLLFTARGLSLSAGLFLYWPVSGCAAWADCFYTGQSPDVHNPHAIKCGGGGGAGWWEGGCGGEGWGCRRGKARVHRCCWLWRLANGGGCMRRSVWLLQTCGPPTLKSKRGGQLVGAYLVASRGLPSRSTAPGSLSPPALHWFPRACTSHHPSSWLQFPVFASMRRPFFAFFLYSCFIASRCYSQEEMNFSTASEISFSALSLWWDMSGSVFPLSAATVFDDTVPAPPVPS